MFISLWQQNHWRHYFFLSGIASLHHFFLLLITWFYWFFFKASIDWGSHLLSILSPIITSLNLMPLNHEQYLMKDTILLIFLLNLFFCLVYSILIKQKNLMKMCYETWPSFKLKNLKTTGIRGGNSISPKLIKYLVIVFLQSW